MNKAKATLIIAIILITAFFGSIPQAQPMTIKRESARPVQGEIIEGRSVIVNVPGSRGYTFVMEV